MEKAREKEVLAWLLGRQQAVAPALRQTVLLGCGHYLLVVVQAALLAWIIDRLVMGGQSVESLIAPFIALPVTVALKSLCARGRELAGQRAGEQVRQQLRQELLTTIAERGPVILAERSSGSWLTLLMEQVDKLQDYYARYLPQMKLVGILPILTLLLVLPFSWVVALILLGTAPLIVMFMILVGNRAAAASHRNVQALSRLSAHFLDRLQGLPTLRLFDRGAAEAAAIEGAAESFREKTMQVLRLAFLSSTVLEFFTAISIAMTAVYLGMSYLGYLEFGFWSSSLTLFTGLFLLLLAPEYYLPLRELGTYYHARADAVGAADEIEAFLAQKHVLVDEGACNSCPPQAAATLRFDNVTVEAANGRRILDSVSFSVDAGQKLAIVGESGAGKTTLLNVLLGFMPYQGQVIINGIELSSLNLASWRSHIAWLGQNPRLFYGSLRENIALSNPSATAAQIERVCEAAHLDEFLHRLPQGLDSRVGDDASGLSVGQAQRVALARALLVDFQLLVLDEPTASLDAHSADIVTDAIHKASENRTTITVSHRYESLNQADQILMLDKGRVSGYGSHAELVACNTQFQSFISQWQQWNREDVVRTGHAVAKSNKGIQEEPHHG